MLTKLPGGRTRLVISGYQTIRPHLLGRFAFYRFYVPVTWIMQARMLAVLKRSVEAITSGAVTPPWTANPT